MAEQQPDPVDQLASVVRRAEARLPDTLRSRGATTLVERLKREAQPPSPVRQPRFLGGYALWALGGACLAAAVTARVVQPRAKLQVQPEAKSMISSSSPHAREQPSPIGTSESAILRPYTRTGAVGRPGATVPSYSPGHSQLEAHAGQAIHAALADCGQLALRGPGKVQVEQSTPSEIVLGLDQGTLLLSFDSQGLRDLVVRTRDARIRVTGTVFSVQAGDGATLVSVLRGAVEVTAHGLPISVAEGRSWRVGEPVLGLLDQSSVALLRDVSAVDGDDSAGSAGESDHRAVSHPTGTNAFGSHSSHREIASRLRRDAGGTQAEGAVNGRKRLSARAAALQVDAAPVVESAGGAAREQSAESLYQEAEGALAAGRTDRAKELLNQLVASYPRDSLVGPASFELGRMAFVAEDFEQARRQLARVRASSQAATARFQEPAAFLVCRSELGLGRRAAAAACVERYRADFHDSPHAADALALLAAIRYRDDGCGLAMPLFDEYLARFPAGAYAPKARAARDRCKR
ncbi:MAG: FecR domain-containing protein [Polyangia bacterium]